MNWWCQPPKEFSHNRYDFATEVYFVGNLFKQIIQENNIHHFKYAEALHNMCLHDPSQRTQSFLQVQKTIQNDPFIEIGFTEEERTIYQKFSDSLFRQFDKIENGIKYKDDPVQVQTQLSDLYRTFMLEKKVPDCAAVLRCFVAGGFTYYVEGLSTALIHDFVKLLKSCTIEKNRIVLANLHTKLDKVPRYSKTDSFIADDDVPF